MPVAHPEERHEPRLTVEMLTEAQSSLADLDWRLLRWLLRYPWQRADDLVVGVARWASRATVYRHLQCLKACKVVESVLPKTPGEGKQLYYLSNLGLHVLARHVGTPAGELAREWQADEAALLRHLAQELFGSAFPVMIGNLPGFRNIRARIRIQRKMLWRGQDPSRVSASAPISVSSSIRPSCAHLREGRKLQQVSLSSCSCLTQLTTKSSNKPALVRLTSSNVKRRAMRLTHFCGTPKHSG